MVWWNEWTILLYKSLIKWDSGLNILIQDYNATKVASQEMEVGSNLTLCIRFWNRNVPGFWASRGQRSETLKVSWSSLEGHCLFLMRWVGWSYLGLGCDPIWWSCKVSEGVRLWFEKKVENLSKFFWLPFETYRVWFFGPIHCKCARSFSFPRFFVVKTHVRRGKMTSMGAVGELGWQRVAAGLLLLCSAWLMAIFFFFHWWCLVWQSFDFAELGWVVLRRACCGRAVQSFLLFLEARKLWCGWASKQASKQHTVDCSPFSTGKRQRSTVLVLAWPAALELFSSYFERAEVSCTAQLGSLYSGLCFALRCWEASQLASSGCGGSFVPCCSRCWLMAKVWIFIPQRGQEPVAACLGQGSICLRGCCVLVGFSVRVMRARLPIGITISTDGKVVGWLVALAPPTLMESKLENFSSNYQFDFFLKPGSWVLPCIRRSRVLF